MADIRVGKPDVSPDLPSHVPSVRQGNSRGGAKQPGFHNTEGGGLRASPRRSTGIRAKDRAPILPDMPNLTPP